MATSTSVSGPQTADADAARPPRPSRHRPRRLLAALLLVESCALLGQAAAVAFARAGSFQLGLGLSFGALGLAFAGVTAVLTARQVTPVVRGAAIACLAVVPTLQWRFTNPLLFTGFDEQLHVRTLVDIVTSHSLGRPNPLLVVSPEYPGLEAVAAFLHEAGLPLVAAGTVTVLAARLVVLFVFAAAVRDLTGNPRTAGLAVAVYALSQQFFLFDAQFAYQTLAVPFALAAVAFVNRARKSPRPYAPMVGATLCLAAVALTHHATSALTAAFFLVWAVAQGRRRGAGRVWLAALVAVATAAVWTWLHWTALNNYFGPIFRQLLEEVHGGGDQRKPFSDAAGTQTPDWERVLLAYYAAATSLLAVFVAFPRLLAMPPLRPLRRLFRRSKPPAHSSLLLTALALAVPVTYGTRSLIAGAEFSARASTFIFFPFALLVAAALVRYPVWRGETRPLRRSVAVLFLASLYVGGIALGAGPDALRLPGSYLPAAEGRSMDAETLAAVQWADDHLEPGSRIAADRISGVLLSSEARLWTVRGSRADEAWLYFSDQWGPPQTKAARILHLQYLYVDLRWADELPLNGAYFHPGETPGPQKLTRDELTKFWKVPGIKVVYHHGPVTIYDLRGLGITPDYSGWTGDRASPALAVQVGIGLLAGLVISGLTAGRLGARPRRLARSFAASSGGALTAAALLAIVCLVSVGLLALQVWLGPGTFATAAVLLLFVHRRRLRLLWRRSVAGVQGSTFAVVGTVLLAVMVAAAAFYVAVSDAAAVTVTAVGEILRNALVG